jgi:ketosteroid isomerase-like protein
MSDSPERAIRSVLSRIDAAWREKRFVGLEDCFAEDAVIVGPNFTLYAEGQGPCAASYKEFALNAAVLEYSETGHALRLWPDTAIYTFSWEMTHQRDAGPKRERGTDQLVLSRIRGGWKVIFRFIYFAPQT